MLGEEVKEIVPEDSNIVNDILKLIRAGHIPHEEKESLICILGKNPSIFKTDHNELITQNENKKQCPNLLKIIDIIINSKIQLRKK